MRITTLRLKNFRSHVETNLELDRLNFIRGPNSCGKSSIQMALEYLFTGRCALTDRAGRGAEALIRAGEKELEVSATLETGETICRRRAMRTHTFEINGKRVPMDAAEAYLAKQFGAADVFSAVLNPSSLIEMSNREQRRILASMVDRVQAEIPSEMRDALRALRQEIPRLASVGDVQAAYKHLSELRAQAVCRLTALGQMEKPDIPPDLPGVKEVRQNPNDLREQNARRSPIRAERIREGERVLERGPQFEGAREIADSQVRERATLETRIRLLERLTEFFGPNGRLMGPVGGRSESFTEHLNRHLAAFGYRCNFSLEPLEIHISGSKESCGGRSLKLLSESEQFQFGVAFQSALALTTGLRFVVIDRADILDQEKRKMLTSWLLNSNLDQAIVLATSEDATPSVLPPAVKFLSLGCKRLEASGFAARRPEQSRTGLAGVAHPTPRAVQ